MLFLTTVFLWAGISVTIPIAIALWNRRQPKQEPFGGFFLLRKLLETNKRRIRLLELLKLLNRLALFSLLVLYFANPIAIEDRLSDAKDGFAIFLDVGRGMQRRAPNSTNTLIDLQAQKLHSLLSSLPTGSQGIVMAVSNRCDLLHLRTDPDRTTATAEQWLKNLKATDIPYTNSETTSMGLSQCLSKVRGLYGNKEIYQGLISPLPATLDLALLQKSNLAIELLPQPSPLTAEKVEVRQEVKGDHLRLFFQPAEERQATLIRARGVESLDKVTDTLDLVAEDQSWILLEQKDEDDPWSKKSLIPLSHTASYRVSLWAQKETPGYLSLLAALRSHPDVKVTREIGAEPSGDPLIIYGSYSFPLESIQARRVWFFVDPDGKTDFKIRDKKQWSSSMSSSDIDRSFHLQTVDGRVFVRKYSLFNLDEFDTIETFEDGAPSLLKSRNARKIFWISPFDLEDLTTDLSLEPTFIPYFYRRLERWLSTSDALQGSQPGAFHAVWLMSGRTPPLPSVIDKEDWPGIYASESKTLVVEPLSLPESYLSYDPRQQMKSHFDEQKISKRHRLINWIIASFFLELLFCMLSAMPFSIAAMFSSFRKGGRLSIILFGIGFALNSPSTVEAANTALRNIPISYFSGMDHDRKVALEQFLIESERLSNLDFGGVSEVSFDKIWQNAVVVQSLTKPFGPLKKEEREKVREYCERGGLLFFDDALATSASPFYESVRSELAQIFPGRELKSIPKDDVLFRTFYLSDEVSGRKLSSPSLEGIEFDKRWVAIFSFNDLLGANLKTAQGDYAYSVTPYGISQRVLAKRLLLNIFMYGVTFDYKDDAIHLPHILKRRVK